LNSPARAARQGVQGGNAEPPERKPRAAYARARSQAEKRTFPFRRKNLARAKLGKLRSAFFCEAVPLGGTAAGRSEAVSFAQNRFGFGHIIAPKQNFSAFCWRGRHFVPPTHFAAENGNKIFVVFFNKF